MNHTEIEEQINSNGVTLVDVREDYEFNEGHIDKAINIPLGTICEDNVKDLPKDKPIYTYCRSGARAESAKNSLESLGFKEVKNIGGIIDWQENGGKLVK